jgi:predicted N-formylglutamate amidohydrolase
MLKLLLTCEHAGNNVPDTYETYFNGHEELLESHKGYDIGALELFDNLKPLACKGFHELNTRLLIELNRSLHHPKLFSAVTRQLSDAEKSAVIKKHYLPYRDQVEHFIHDFVMAGRQVVHIAVHTFTPELDGEIRDADIGLLYDPKRKGEQSFCKLWKSELSKRDETLLVRYNYPYLGIADGLTTYLRRKFKGNEYLGIELEVNQKFALGEQDRWQQLHQVIKHALGTTIEKLQPADFNA